MRKNQAFLHIGSKGMNIPSASRRRFVGAALALVATSSAHASAPLVQVWKAPSCGCCKDWIAILQREGFGVQVFDEGNNAMRARLGLPQRYGSCHTARVGGYVVEGHVPVREIRRLKARMESERLPRGGDPKWHIKLGRGGLSDIEWTIQLLQMQHAHDHPELRTTSTLDALRAQVRAGLIEAADAECLEAAWRFASDLRNAMVLWRGRVSDSVPADVRDAEGAHRILGGGPGEGAELIERYRRNARHARAVTERVFYGRQPMAEAAAGRGTPPATRRRESGR